MNLKNPGIGGETGLPDYVRDHFEYLIRGSGADRAGQAIFFGSSLSLPFVVGICLLIWEGDVFGAAAGILIGTGIVFFLSLFGISGGWPGGWRGLGGNVRQVTRAGTERAELAQK